MSYSSIPFYAFIIFCTYLIAGVYRHIVGTVLALSLYSLQQHQSFFDTSSSNSLVFITSIAEQIAYADLGCLSAIYISLWCFPKGLVLTQFFAAAAGF